MSDIQIGQRVIVIVPEDRSGAVFNGTEGVVSHCFETSPNACTLQITRLVWCGEEMSPESPDLTFWAGEFRPFE